MNIVKNILYHIALNFLVGCSALVQSLISAKFFISKDDFYKIIPISTFHFFLSWAAYHILRYDRKWRESSANLRRYFFIVLFVLLGIGIHIGQNIYSTLNFNQILNYTFSLILVVLYGTPSTGLRNHLVLRYVVIILVWFSVTGLTFVLMNENLCFRTDHILFLLNRLLLFFVCILPFDMMDKDSDLKESTTTLAHRISEKSMQIIIWITISLMILISYREFLSTLVVAMMMGMILWIGKKFTFIGKLLAESILVIEGIVQLLTG